VQEALEGVVAARGAKPKQVFQPIRVALAGTAISPGIFETLTVLGRDESLARIGKIAALITSSNKGLNHLSTAADTGSAPTIPTRKQGPTS
jgi:hypothetical protein